MSKQSKDEIELKAQEKARRGKARGGWRHFEPTSYQLQR